MLWWSVSSCSSPTEGRMSNIISTHLWILFFPPQHNRRGESLTSASKMWFVSRVQTIGIFFSDKSNWLNKLLVTSMRLVECFPVTYMNVQLSPSFICPSWNSVRRTRLTMMGSGQQQKVNKIYRIGFFSSRSEKMELFLPNKICSFLINRRTCYTLTRSLFFTVLV